MKTAEHAKSAEGFSREGNPPLLSFSVFSAISAVNFESAGSLKGERYEKKDSDR